MYDGYANALRLVLNGNNVAHVDVERLAETFTFAVSNLCQPTDASIDYCSYRADVNYRHLLKVHVCQLIIAFIIPEANFDLSIRNKLLHSFIITIQFQPIE